MRELRGKVAVVTGAGSGIGRATTLALTAAGSTVAVCDIDAGSARDTVEAVRRNGGQASAHDVDVSSEEAMHALAAGILAQHHAVDIVVNCAGIAPAPSPSTAYPLDRFRRVMDVNFWGVVHGSVAFLPHLLRRPEANLLNVASETALMGFPRMAAYVSSKFAVRGFTEVLRMELAGTPVKVTLVCPGSTKTPIMANSPVIDEEQRRLIQRHFDNAWGRRPEVVAERLVSALRRDRPRVLIGADTVAVDAVARLLPGAHSRLLARPVKRFMESVLGQAS